MKAYELLADPAKWAQGYEAYNANGEGCMATSLDAVKWCAMGAIEKVHYPYSSTRDAAYDKLLNYLFVYTGYRFVGNWNDAKTTTHADVVRVLKELDL